MTVIRVIHNRENPFVQLNKEALWNENLSLKATGLWARCMSRPDNWRFVISELVEKCKEGRTAIYGAIDELIAHKYALRLEERQRSLDGKIVNTVVEYIFFEFPTTEEEITKYQEDFKKFFRHSGFRNSGCGDSGNQHLLNIEYIYKQKEENKAQALTAVANAPASSPSSRKKIKEAKEEVADYVWLTKTQQAKLLEKVGNDPEKLKKCYIRLSDWKIQKGITDGKNDYMAIINWVINAINDDENQPSKVPVAERNKIFAQQVVSLHPNHPDIDMGTDYIEIRSGVMHTLHQKFIEKDLKNKVIHELKKKKLSVEGLQ